jgi:hypothetical protein
MKDSDNLDGIVVDAIVDVIRVVQNPETPNILKIAWVPLWMRSDLANVISNRRTELSAHPASLLLVPFVC